MSETRKERSTQKTFLQILEPSPQLAIQISLRGKYGGGGDEGGGSEMRLPLPRFEGIENENQSSTSKT